MFFAKLVQPFIGVDASGLRPTAVHCLIFSGVDSNAIVSARRTSPSAPSRRGRRQARSKRLRCTAVSKQAGEHNQAPRPGAVRLSTATPVSGSKAQRHIADAGWVVRQPMHVRTG